MPPVTSLTLIVAALSNGGVGRNGELPWRIAGDMRYFQRVTTWMGRRPGSAFPPSSNMDASQGSAPLNVVIMGRKTWESIPRAFRPLKHRMNIVLSRSDEVQAEVRSASTRDSPTYGFSSLELALNNLQNLPHSSVFIIGGAQLYSSSMTHPLCTQILLTTLDANHHIECDAFFPRIPTEKFRQTSWDELADLLGPECPQGGLEEKGFRYEFQLWKKRDTETSFLSSSKTRPRVAAWTCVKGALPRDTSAPSYNPATDAPEKAGSGADAVIGRSYSLSHSHPLLSLQIDPSMILLPSDVSSYSTILPEDLVTTSGVDPPPEGIYSPVFSPEKSHGTNTTHHNGKITSPAATVRSEAGWGGSLNSSIGATPSEYAAQEQDDEDDDDMEAYESLIRRVEEVLSDMGHSANSHDGEDPETSLLAKVHEILQLGSSTDVDSDATTIVARDISTVRQQRVIEDNRTAVNQMAVPTDKRSCRDGRREDIEAPDAYDRDGQAHGSMTAINFSLADGTYADVTKQPHRRDIMPRTPASHGLRHHINEPRGTRDAYLARKRQGALHSPQKAPPANSPSSFSSHNLGGMAGSSSIYIPTIEYESIISEDTMVERELAPLMAKYNPALPHALGTHDPTPPRFPATNNTTTNETHISSLSIDTASSATFADQLSVASLEYMKRHALMQTSPAPSPPQRAADPFARLLPADARAKREQLSKILDVERIRRLPKLGMPDGRRLA